MQDRSGQQIDNYRLLKLLGGGTFGDVYLAEDLRRTPATRVAFKLLAPFKTAQEMQLFFNEVRALMRLRHPHIVPVLDFGIEQGDAFLVMEYAPNGTLRQRHPRGSQIPLSTVVEYVKQLAEALQHAHDDRLMHLDVKPDNVLLGANDQLLLSDFGIATMTPTGRIDLNQAIQHKTSGTPAYMPPEQWKGNSQKASDQYALAIMAYEWLCGELPFVGNQVQLQYQHTTQPVPPLREKLPTISPQGEAVIMKALAKDPKDRYPTVRAFAEALASVMVRKIEFSGYTWIVADSSQEKRGPGPNYFSASSENVWIDSQGQLHLKLTYKQNRWYCAEVSLDKPLGYGTYNFDVVGRFDLLDPQVVVGLFLYRDDTHEIDIEFARWGKRHGENLQYVLQPGDRVGNLHRCEATLSGDYTSHRIVWQPENVSFRSLHGHYVGNPPSDDYLISAWSFGKAYYKPTTERVLINLWLHNGQPPGTNENIEIVIKQFSFQQA
jgi:serine/threonine protein kinase